MKTSFCSDYWTTVAMVAEAAKKLPASMRTISVGDAWLDKPSDISPAAGTVSSKKIGALWEV